MNTLEISEAKILRGDIIEKLYGTYGVDIRIAALRNALRSKGLLPEENLKNVFSILVGKEKICSCGSGQRKLDGFTDLADTGRCQSGRGRYYGCGGNY